MTDIINFLSNIKDEREKYKIKHKLSDIVLLTLIAILAGTKYWIEIEDFGILNEKKLKRYLELPNGIPSHDTIQRVLASIKPDIL